MLNKAVSLQKMIPSSLMTEWNREVAPKSTETAEWKIESFRKIASVVKTQYKIQMEMQN